MLQEQEVESVTEDLVTSEEKQGKRSKKIPSKPRFNKFVSSWTEIKEFKNWLIKGNKKKQGHEMAFCKVCSLEITAHRSDITRHYKSDRHQNTAKQVAHNVQLPDMFSNKTQKMQTKRAEIKLAGLLAEKNLPFSLMDVLSPLCHDLFPDSEIAKQISAKRMKATSILKNAIGKEFKEKLNEK